VLSAIREVKEVHPSAHVFYLADALPGFLPRSEGSQAEYFPPLMTGAEIAAAILQALANFKEATS
jgi:hypothetical protein